MAKKKLLEDIRAQPARFYRTPADVLRDRRFADVERLEILRAWMTQKDDAVLGQLEAMIAEIESRLVANDHAAE